MTESIANVFSYLGKKTYPKTSFSFDLNNPLVMGILNVSPNSFSTVGRFPEPDQALEHAKKLVDEGANIIDVGAEATNPESHPLTATAEEIRRILPIIELLAAELPVPISIDTSKPKMMYECVKHGASMINDVRALRWPGAREVAAELDVPVCLMHMVHPFGKSITSEESFTQPIVPTIKTFLAKQIEACIEAGIKLENIIIDPGFGHGNFGKTTQQNLLLLNQLPEFKSLGRPILVGLSRKTFIGDILQLPEADRLVGSLAAAVIAVIKGASIIRVHDVKATVEAIKIATAVLKQEN